MKKTLVAMVFVVSLVISSVVHADISQSMSYQALITDSNGNPLNGNYNMRFIGEL